MVSRLSLSLPNCPSLSFHAFVACTSLFHSACCTDPRSAPSLTAAAAATAAVAVITAAADSYVSRCKPISAALLPLPCRRLRRVNRRSLRPRPLPQSQRRPATATAAAGHCHSTAAAAATAAATAAAAAAAAATEFWLAFFINSSKFCFASSSSSFSITVNSASTGA